MKMEINIDPELQRRARAVCRNASVDKIEDKRPRLDSYNPDELDDLW